MRKKIVAGNWKMNGQINRIKDLLQSLITLLSKQTGIECVVMPPTIYLPLVTDCLTNTSIKWGAQNVYPQDAGAFTGEISGPMLQDFNCSYVLVGHSERRRLFGEDEKFIADKFHHVKEHDMIPVLCVGETLQEREKGLTEKILSQQLLAVTGRAASCFERCVIAYEPVWAIGTGKTASPQQVQEVHEFIRSYIAGFEGNNANQVSILYGGSVNEMNAGSLFAMPDVDGGLIGGASLNAQQFVEIVKCIN